ncbi:MAG: FAD-binding oxidoreductase [Bryobacterales bacterium]|nr:FAD-binding oxidoreductase [Bryobacterales bacterium]
MNDSADVVIIGAGIVGACCAHLLRREGMRVLVVESGVVAGGATGAGMGHIVAMDDNPAEYALTLYSQGLWNELLPHLPEQVEYDACGTLWVAADDEEMRGVDAKYISYTMRGVRADVLDGRDVAEAEPALRDGLAGGLLVRDDSVIYAPCATAWFLQGVDVRYGRVVSVPGDGVQLEDGALLRCGMVICAAGAKTSALFPQLDVRPRKGHLAITDRYPGFVRHQLVELGYLKSAHGHSTESVAFNVQPRKTGQLLIGSSRQYGVESPAIDRPLLQRMLQRALEYIPGLGELSVIRTWTGFRPSTPDNMPAIGVCPERENVWFATGHEGLGITTSLGTAHLLVDLMSHRTPAIDASPFAPGRLWRDG